MTLANYKTDLAYDLLNVVLHGNLNGELDVALSLDPAKIEKLALREIYAELRRSHSQRLPLTTALVIHRLRQCLKDRLLLENVVEVLLEMEREKDEAVRIAGRWEYYFQQLGGSLIDTFDAARVLQLGCELEVLDIEVKAVAEGLIYEKAINLFSAKGGMGKTILSLQISNAIVQGSLLWGLNTIAKQVIYIDFENSLPTLVDRIKRIGAKNVLFWHASNAVRPPRLDSSDWANYKKLPKDSVIVFDTLRAAHGLDENSSREMSIIMNRLKEIRDDGFTIILLHHTPKSNDRQYKGSSAIYDLSDHVLSLYKVKKGSFAEIQDEDFGGDFCYKFGTQDKTRYEPFSLYLEFDALAKCFKRADDPNEDDLRAISGLLAGKEPMNQGALCKLIKDKLGIKSTGKIISLLKKGEGRLWETSPTGLKNSVLYTGL